ncbi:MAG: hypothetical protein ACLSFT_02435 [Ruminococcus callidus]
MLFLFLLTCLGSSIPVSAEAEEEPEVLTAIASADVFFSGFLLPKGILSNWKNLSIIWKMRFPI